MVAVGVFNRPERECSDAGSACAARSCLAETIGGRLVKGEPVAGADEGADLPAAAPVGPGTPQCGQELASVDTSLAHSRHWANVIATPHLSSRVSRVHCNQDRMTLTLTGTYKWQSPPNVVVFPCPLFRSRLFNKRALLECLQSSVSPPSGEFLGLQV